MGGGLEGMERDGADKRNGIPFHGSAIRSGSKVVIPYPRGGGKDRAWINLVMVFY